MKNLSEFKTRKEWEEFIWFQFIERLAKIKSTEQLQKTLEIFLSAKERDFIIRRIIISALISQGKKYREIGDILWISHGTISAIKKSIAKKSIYRGYQHYIVKNHKGIEKNVKKITFDDLGEAMMDFMDWFASLPIPSGSGKGNWDFLNLYKQDKARYGGWRKK